MQLIVQWSTFVSNTGKWSKSFQCKNRHSAFVNVRVLLPKCTSRIALFRKPLQILNLPRLGIYFSNFQSRTGRGNIFRSTQQLPFPMPCRQQIFKAWRFLLPNSVRIYRFLAWLQNWLSQGHSLPNTPSSTFNKWELEEQMTKGHPFHVLKRKPSKLSALAAWVDKEYRWC